MKFLNNMASNAYQQLVEKKPYQTTSLPSLKVPPSIDLNKLTLDTSLSQSSKTSTQAVMPQKTAMSFPVETEEAIDKLKWVASGGQYFKVDNDLQIKYERK